MMSSAGSQPKGSGRGIMRGMMGCAMAVLLALSAPASAVLGYAMQTYYSGELSGGVAIPGTTGNDIAVTLNAPFRFAIYETMVEAGTPVMVSTKGVVAVQAPDFNAANTTLPTAAFTGPALFPFWDDFNSIGMHQGVASIAPHRRWTITWWGHRNGDPSNAFVDITVMLYENSSTVDFRYNSPWPAAANGTVGMQESPTGRSFTVPKATPGAPNEMNGADYQILAANAGTQNLVLRFVLQRAPNYTVHKLPGTETFDGPILAGTNADDSAIVVTAPFRFGFYDRVVDPGASVMLSTNGAVVLQAAPAALYVNTSLPTSSVLTDGYAAPALFPFWDDLFMAGPGWGISTTVLDSAPNRRWAITFRGIAIADATQSLMKFSVVFFENSSTVEYHYETPWGPGSSGTVGLQEGPTGRFLDLPKKSAGATNQQTQADYVALTAGLGGNLTLRFVLQPTCAMDIDGNGAVDALTDGLLILRSMFGLSGTAVTTGATAGTVRTTWPAIRDYLAGACQMPVLGP